MFIDPRILPILALVLMLGMVLLVCATLHVLGSPKQSRRAGALLILLLRLLLGRDRNR